MYAMHQKVQSKVDEILDSYALPVLCAQKVYAEIMDSIISATIIQLVRASAT